MSEPCECFGDSLRKARKDHRCEECGGVIPAGSTYAYGSGIFEGRPFSIKRHHECAVLYNDCCRRVGQDECPAFGELAEWLNEIHGETHLDLQQRWQEIKLKYPRPLRP